MDFLRDPAAMSRGHGSPNWRRSSPGVPAPSCRPEIALPARRGLQARLSAHRETSLCHWVDAWRPVGEGGHGMKVNVAAELRCSRATTAGELRLKYKEIFGELTIGLHEPRRGLTSLAGVLRWRLPAA